MMLRIVTGLAVIAIFIVPGTGADGRERNNMKSVGEDLAEQSTAIDSSSGPYGGRYTLVTNGWVDVREVLGTLAAKSGLGLEIAPDVCQDVIVHLVDVPLKKALQSLLDPAGLGYEIVDGVLIVHNRGMVTRWFSFDYPVTEREGRGELLVSSGGNSDGNENTENESHVTSTAVMKVWPQVINSVSVLVFNENTGGDGGGASSTDALSLADDEGRILVVNPMAGLIQVTAEWPRVRQVEGLLKQMEESLRRQVAIEVKILEVMLWETDKTGIDWTTITGRDVNASLISTENLVNPALSFIVNSKNITGLMEIISEYGNVKTLSTPRITTLNNQKAVVRVVTEEVFFVADVEPAVISNGTSTTPVVEYSPEIFPVGLVLDVTPQIGKDGVIILNVHPTISNIVREETSPNEDSAPVISIRELDTVGRVAGGKTLVIAGLMSEGNRVNEYGVPFLKDIPLLGYLFKRSSKEKTTNELVIMLTPVILDGDMQVQTDGDTGPSGYGELID